MDYIQEELRRQREALAAVLLGGGARRTPEDGREAGRLPAGPLSTVRPAAAERAAQTALSSGDTQWTGFAAEGGIAGTGSAPAAFDGGVTGAGVIRPREEIAAVAAESGGAGPAALRERGLAAPSPGAAEASGDRWTAAAAEAPGDRWTAAAVEALGNGRADAAAEIPGGGWTAVETEAPGGGWSAVEAEAPADGWTALGSGYRGARQSQGTAEGAVPSTVRRSRGAPAAERTVTELVYPAGDGAAVTAEALSRAFQRDARRYDGGFAPY